MSTRAQIKVVGSEIMIYKHCDGYPSDVMPTLENIVSTFIKARGNEPDYALAQIMRAFARKEEKERQEFLNDESQKKWHDLYKKPLMTGWGLDCTIHGDLDYFYTVDLSTGKITVFNYVTGEENIKEVF